jgi:hypothetical protein
LHRHQRATTSYALGINVGVFFGDARADQCADKTARSRQRSCGDDRTDARDRKRAQANEQSDQTARDSTTGCSRSRALGSFAASVSCIVFTAGVIGNDTHIVRSEACVSQFLDCCLGVRAIVEKSYDLLCHALSSFDSSTGFGQHPLLTERVAALV